MMMMVKSVSLQVHTYFNVHRLYENNNPLKNFYKNIVKTKQQIPEMQEWRIKRRLTDASHKLDDIQLKLLNEAVLVK